MKVPFELTFILFKVIFIHLIIPAFPPILAVRTLFGAEAWSGNVGSDIGVIPGGVVGARAQLAGTTQACPDARFLSLQSHRMKCRNEEIIKRARALFWEWHYV
jgi:hypothetical protein